MYLWPVAVALLQTVAVWGGGVALSLYHMCGCAPRFDDIRCAKRSGSQKSKAGSFLRLLRVDKLYRKGLLYTTAGGLT